MASHDLVEALPERFDAARGGYLADLTCTVRCFLQEPSLFCLRESTTALSTRQLQSAKETDGAETDVGDLDDRFWRCCGRGGRAETHNGGK